MFECLGCFIYGILTVTATHKGLAIPIPRINSLALQIALDDKNLDTNLSDNIKTHINNNNKLNHGSKGDIQKKFTDFIQAVIEILNKYDDLDIENFFNILNDEVGKYRYHGCKFSELTDNNDFKIIIASKFVEMKDMPAADIRRMILHIAKHIEDAKYHNQEKDLIDFINSLYRQDSVGKFKKFLNKINDYRLKTEADLNLEKIIREGLRTLIFNHCTKMNYNTRAALKSKLDEYWEHMKPLPVSLRSQLHPIEMKLLDNENENIETFYFTKKQKYNSETKYQTKNWMTGANMKTVSYINVYPKLPVDLQIMNYQSVKPRIHTLSRLKQDSFSYKPDNDVSLKSDNKLDDQNFIEQSMSGENNQPTTTAIVPYQMYEENSNDDANHDTASEVRNKVTDVTASNYDYVYEEDLSTPRAEQFNAIGRQGSFSKPEPKRQSYTKYKRSEATRAPYASFYTITAKSHITKKRLTQMPPGGKKQVPKKIARTVFTTRKAFIEVVTMRPFVPTRIRNPIKIKYDLYLKSAKTQPTSEVQNPAKPREYISSNEDSANVENGLSIEEIKDERGTRAYRKSFNNYLPADTVLIDKDVLTRIKQLENDLSKVKTLAKNDTEMIEDLKSNIEFIETEAEKQSKEFVLAEVIPCNSGDKEITNASPEDVDRRQHGENKDEHINNLKKQQNSDLSAKQRIVQRKHLDRSNFDVPGRITLSIEDMKMKHNFEKYKIQKLKHRKLQIHSVRGELSNVDNLEYKDKEYNIDTNEEKYVEDNTLHSRRTMINKVEEIKKKIDGAEDNHEITRKESYFSAKANAGFNNELIPDSDVFNRNMKELENYLARENNTELRYDSNKDRFQNEKGEEPDNIYSGAMLYNDGSENNVNYDKNVFALNKTEVNKEYAANENVFGKTNRETLKESNRTMYDIPKSFLKTNNNKFSKQLENTLNHDRNRDNQVKNYGNRGNQEKFRSPDKDMVFKDNQRKPEFSTSINTEEDRNQQYAQTSKENKDSVSFDKEHNIRRSINFNQNILDSNKRAINPIHKHGLVTPKSDKETSNKVEGIYKKSPTYPPTTDISTKHHKSNTEKITKATLSFKLSKLDVTTENNIAFHNNNNSSNDYENITRKIVHDFQLNKSKAEIETKINPTLNIISTTSLRKQSSITGQYSTGSNEIELKKESEVKPPSQNQHQNSNKESQFQKDEQDRSLNNFKEDNVDQKIDFGNVVFRRSFVNNEPKESINNNKENIKMNDKPFKREDFYIQDKESDIDWENINMPKMLDEISEKIDKNKETAKMASPKPITMVAAGPTTRITQTQSTTSTTTTATPQAYLPTDIFNLRETNESFNPIYKDPFNMNVPKYGFSHPSKDIFRKNNNLPLAPPAGSKNIRIDNEEAFNLNLRSHLKVPLRLNYTRTTLDIESLFKKMGPMPESERIIIDKLNEHAASIGSGRRNMDANITLGPIAEHTEDIFGDPFLSDVENAFGTKQPSVSTLEDDVDI